MSTTWRHLALALSVVLVVPAALVWPGPGLARDVADAVTALSEPDGAADAALAFELVTVASRESTGEPSILVDSRTSPPSVFVVAPESSTQLWRSTDGGASFARLARTPGGGDVGAGDSDVAMDADGVLYVSDLLGAGTLRSSVPVSTSLDGGASYARMVELDPAAPGAEIKWDRQWTAARGSGHVVTSARSGDTYANWVSTDAGVTFSGPHTIATDVRVGGPMVFGADGTLYAVYHGFDSAVHVAQSADGGVTWSSSTVSGTSGDLYLFPSLAVDDDGNLHVAWSQGVGPVGSDLGVQVAPKTLVYYASSADGGASWSAPRIVSDNTRSSVFPWVAAGAAGKVNVAFLTANQATDPNLGTATTTWSLELAQSLDALAATPTFTRVTVDPLVHTGSICTSGLLCVGPQNLAGMGNVPTPFDRRHLDFFEMDLDADGNAFIAYTKSRPFPTGNAGDALFSWVDVMVARQTGGSALR